MAKDVSSCFPVSARILLRVAWLWFAVAVVYLTDAACFFMTFFALLGSGMVIGFVWVIFTHLWPRLLSKPIRRFWLSIPLAGVLAVILATDIGLLLRVSLCDRVLRDHVTSVAPHGVKEEQSRWIGLFQVDETRVYDGGVYLYTSHSWLNRHGIAHIPVGSKLAPRTNLRHLYGQWFSFEWRF
jgi:hypothetical protein